MLTPIGAERCAVAPEVAADFPHLALWMMTVSVGAADVREASARLGELGDRVRHAVTGGLRTHRVAQEYRAFARQIGIDPDVDRNPLEAAMMVRLHRGEFLSQGIVEDALLIAMLETAVPLWSLDGSRVSGYLSVRAGEAGALTVADDRRVLAPLLGMPVAERRPDAGAETVVVYALRVGRITDGMIGEALWTARQWLEGR